jgi:hypothetical protein
MMLTPPKKWVFWVSLLLGLVGLIGKLVTITFLTTYAFWFVLAGLVLLALGNALKGF